MASSSVTPSAIRKRKQRESQCEEQYNIEKATNTAVVTKRRANETTEEKEARLNAARTAQKSRRSTETIEEKEARLNADRTAQKSRRSTETMEEKEARLNADRTSQKSRRSTETMEEKEARLNAVRTAQKSRRSTETMEEKEARLNAVRTTQKSRRSTETMEQKHERLAKQQKHTAMNRAALKKVKPTTSRAAVFGTENAVEPTAHYLGTMTTVCKYNFCQGLHFPAEKGRLMHSCCHDGKALAPPLSPYPDELGALITGTTSESKNFREHIRQYNCANAFASFGAKMETVPGNGPYCFKISGEVYHQATSALVENDPTTASQVPRYGQLFIYDPDAAINYRMSIEQNKGCHAKIMQTIDSVMRRDNPYVQQYRNLALASRIEQQQMQNQNVHAAQHTLVFIRSNQDDQRRYNAPVTNKDCMYLIESAGGEIPNIDLAVHPVGQRGCRRINQNSRHVDPMVFPIFFPKGDAGCTIHAENSIEGGKHLTALQFYSSRIAARGEFNPLHRGGKLYQQYVVHAYCTVEAQRLSYIKFNQQQLRVECYQGLIDYLAHAAQEQDLRPGNLTILPATFVGGPRYMRQKYHDAMSIVRKFGRPDLFITFTCNPKWPEVYEQLQPFQEASDRPDIISRVFELKVEAFMDLVIKQCIFGHVIAFVFVIEFQKRGLPHLHSLFWLAEGDSFHTADDVDKVISAEIPEYDANPELYNIIMKNNIHGPCGILNPKCICMENGQCKKRFPKPFNDQTDTSGEGYPVYRRRDNSNEDHVARNIHIDNGWVVPYNPFLSRTFDAHINVEMCHTVQAIKYLCKYFTKGHDRARIGFSTDDENRLSLNEIKEFVDARCITPPEATWRLLENKLHDQSHSIIQLHVHLPNGQRIFFNEGQEEEALRRASTNVTTLTAWFKLNQSDINAHDVLYQDIPTNYVFENKKLWKPRKRGGESVIGRVASISPRNVEAYHLRLLLLNVPGACSFEELRTFGGTIYETYREAALARDLIVDDQEWRKCMQEASQYMMPKQLRSLFSILLIHCNLLNAEAIWDEFRACMMEDFLHHGNDEEQATTMALLEIQKELQLAGFSCKDKGIPEPAVLSNEQEEQQEDDALTCAIKGADMFSKLNNDQRQIADAILAAVNNYNSNKANCFFIDGPGGTGKTFLHATLINTLRGQGKEVLPVAWTGIAAILLLGGKTCHTAFRLPLDLKEDSACHLSKAEKLLLIKVDAIIWDEAPMASKDALELVDRMLRDLMKKEHIPFGGKVMVLSGDFRQVLPVIKGGTRLQVIRKCIKSSDLWKHFQQKKLNVNMRANLDQISYAEWLLQLGSDELIVPETSRMTESSVVIPKSCISSDVINNIFPMGLQSEDASVHSCAILSPLNEDCMQLNEKILDRLQGEKITLKSIDTVEAVEGEDEAQLQQMYPVEFLNTVQMSGLPPHCLNLKKGAIIMLIRNLSIAQGLCNGTRLCVMDIKPTIVQAKIISGARSGSIHFIPRITLNTKDDVNVPFNLCRRQFPIKLAYAMTINKAQGQTFDKVGLYLKAPVFSHGQLYVACSRVKSIDSLYIQVVPDQKQGVKGGETVTNNIVFKNVLH